MSLDIKETKEIDDATPSVVAPFPAEEFCFLTTSQIVQKLQISPPTLDAWKRKRIIPFITIGGVVRFELARVLEALRAYETPVSPEPAKPEKLGINRTGLTKRDAHGRLLPRDSVAARPEGEAT